MKDLHIEILTRTSSRDFCFLQEGQCISSEKGSSSDVSPSCYVASPDSYLNSILSMHLGLHPLPSSSNSVLPGSADQVTIPLTAVAERPALFNMTPLELAVLLGVIVVVTVMVVLSLSFITNRNKNMAMSYSDSSGSGSSGRSVTKMFDVNMFGVGKITFDPNELLGIHWWKSSWRNILISWCSFLQAEVVTGRASSVGPSTVATWRSSVFYPTVSALPIARWLFFESRTSTPTSYGTFAPKPIRSSATLLSSCAKEH